MSPMIAQRLWGHRHSQQIFLRKPADYRQKRVDVVAALENESTRRVLSTPPRWRQRGRGCDSGVIPL